MFRFAGRQVENADDIAFDFDGDGYLDPIEEEALMDSLDDEDENEDDEYDELDDDFDDDEDW